MRICFIGVGFVGFLVKGGSPLLDGRCGHEREDEEGLGACSLLIGKITIADNREKKP